jgi:GrpB-like predicted nucleotidyltransferase (UPF0157 family)
MSEVVLTDYQPQWSAQFVRVATELRSVFACAEVQIEHIGSTAVPGLCAKPVLDMLLGAAGLAVVQGSIASLAALGFVYRPEYEDELPGRRYFVRPAHALPRVHLHAVVRGGELWHTHLRFRDRLRQDSATRDRYATLKRELAARHRDDKAAYTQAKAPFIQALLADLQRPA